MEYLKTLGVVVGTGVFTTLLLMTWVHVEVRLSSVKYSVALVTGRDLGKSKMAIVSSDLPGGGASERRRHRLCWLAAVLGWVSSC
jgi:hypothetical protein